MLQQTPPGDGGRASTPTRFFNRKVKRGEKLQGWTAGKPHWFTCHTHKRPTKPCLDAITGGQLKCRACGEKTQTMGYVPFYDFTNTKPHFVLVYDYDRVRLDKLSLHAGVHIFREDREDAPIAVLAMLGKEYPKYQTTLSERQRAVDLTTSLLLCWNIPELVEWYNQIRPASDKPLSLPDPVEAKAKATGAEKKKKPSMTQAAYDLIEQAEAEGGTYDEVVQRIKRRMGGVESVNGKHKPEGGQS